MDAQEGFDQSDVGHHESLAGRSFSTLPGGRIFNYNFLVGTLIQHVVSYGSPVHRNGTGAKFPSHGVL